MTIAKTVALIGASIAAAFATYNLPAEPPADPVAVSTEAEHMASGRAESPVLTEPTADDAEQVDDEALPDTADTTPGTCEDDAAMREAVVRKARAAAGRDVNKPSEDTALGLYGAAGYADPNRDAEVDTVDACPGDMVTWNGGTGIMLDDTVSVVGYADADLNHEVTTVELRNVLNLHGVQVYRVTP